MRRWATALLVVVAGCGGFSAQPPASGPIVVFAAASLSEAFHEVGVAFQKRNPGDVQFNFAGSQALVAQVSQGAPVDVFASADQVNMQRLVDSGSVLEPPRIFAANQLQIVVPAGNPKSIRSLADLADPAKLVVLCAPAVPCGNYSAQALARAGVKVAARSQEQDVKAVVTRVALREADAGIAYVTDVRAAGSRVQGVDIPAEQNVAATYPIAVVRTGSNPGRGRSFVDFVLSSEGQSILGRYGFAKP